MSVASILSSAPKAPFSVSKRLEFAMRGIAFILGSFVCAIGCVVAISPIGEGESLFWLKLVMGGLMFIAGMILARLGRVQSDFELHFDPDRGEYFVLQEGAGPDKAIVLAQSRNAEISVHGRHCTIVDRLSRNTLNIAMDDPLLAMALAENYRKYSTA